MTTPGNVRTQMIQRAARLVYGTQNEEAWHLVGLFQQTQPTTFLHICHHLLASFLELTHDYFDQDWPLTTRLLKPSLLTMTESRRGRNRIPSEVFELTPEIAFVNPHTPTMSKHQALSQQQQQQRLANSPLLSPIVLNSGPFGLQDTNSSNGGGDGTNSSAICVTNRLGRFKSRAGKRLFKQLLPSRPPTPMTTAAKATCFEWNSSKSTDRSHSNKTRSFFRQCTRNPISTTPFSHPDDFARSGYPFGSATTNQAAAAATKMMLPSLGETESNRFILNSCCNVDTTICATLIEYMLVNPQICMTEGIFRVPGNSVRIRDLWLNLCGQIQAPPYLRVSQPEPDFNSSCLTPHPVDNRNELYQFLNTYSPHDIASLLLRCLSTCSQNSDSTSSRPMSIGQSVEDFTAECSPRGLIPPQAGELLFLATQLQYALDEETGKENSEDWMHILCQSRQLLAYRIVIQLLLPAPERCILMELLRLLKQISQYSESSKMTVQCLSRCIAFAIFGTPPTSSPENVGNSSSTTNPLRWRIDTLHNLIELVDQLEDLPGIVYNTVRDRLRSRLGNSPIPRPNAVPTAVLLGKNVNLQLDTDMAMPCTKYTSGSLVRHTLPLVIVNSTENYLKPNQLHPNTPKRSASTDRNRPTTKPTIQTTPELLVFARGSDNRISLHRAKSTLDQTSRSDQIRSSHQPTDQTLPTTTTTTPFHHIWRRQKHSSSELRAIPPTTERKKWLMKVKSSANLVVQDSRSTLSS